MHIIHIRHSTYILEFSINCFQHQHVVNFISDKNFRLYWIFRSNVVGFFRWKCKDVVKLVNHSLVSRIKWQEIISFRKTPLSMTHERAMFLSLILSYCLFLLVKCTQFNHLSQFKKNFFSLLESFEKLLCYIFFHLFSDNFTLKVFFEILLFSVEEKMFKNVLCKINGKIFQKWNFYIYSRRHSFFTHVKNVWKLLQSP